MNDRYAHIESASISFLFPFELRSVSRPASLPSLIDGQWEQWWGAYGYPLAPWGVCSQGGFQSSSYCEGDPTSTGENNVRHTSFPTLSTELDILGEERREGGETAIRLINRDLVEKRQ